MNFICAICGNKNGKILFEVYDRLYNTPGRYYIVKCLKCNLLQTYPKPTNIAELYPPEYGAYKPLKDTPILSLLQKIYRRVFDTGAYYTPDLPVGSKILEIGCGSGQFISRIIKKGWDIHALDISLNAIKHVEKLGVKTYHGDLIQARFKDSTFDAIFAWAVVEHIENLIDTLKEIRRVLKPNGIFIFNIPNAASLPSKMLKEMWFLDIPRHLYHFTPQTITYALKTTKFNVFKITHPRHLISLLWSIIWLFDKISEKTKCTQFVLRHQRICEAIFIVITIPLASFLSFVRQTDTMTVIAKPTKRN